MRIPGVLVSQQWDVESVNQSKAHFHNLLSVVNPHYNNIHHQTLPHPLRAKHPQHSHWLVIIYVYKPCLLIDLLIGLIKILHVVLHKHIACLSVNLNEDKKNEVKHKKLEWCSEEHIPPPG